MNALVYPAKKCKYTSVTSGASLFNLRMKIVQSKKAHKNEQAVDLNAFTVDIVLAFSPVTIKLPQV